MSASGAAFAALLASGSLWERIVRTMRQQDVFVDASESCLSLSHDAFRCAELQGFRHPLCIARKIRHTHCVARMLAPEFLERVETCEMRSGNESEECVEYERDLTQVVSKRLNQHVDQVEFTLEERRGAAACGLPLEARSTFELNARLECMAGIVCKDTLSLLEKCYDGAGDIDGACSLRSRALVDCLAQSTGRMYFVSP
jgi:hypothetical protein